MDEFFAFRTTKYVEILDWKIGCCQYCLFSFGLIYVLVILIAYQGQHLQTNTIFGVHQLKLQHPTKCNPFTIHCKAQLTPQQDLAYCLASNKTHPEKRDCKFVDGTRLRISGPQGFTIPTRIERYSTYGDEAKDGYINFLDKDNHSQTSDFQHAVPIEDYYIQDVDNFTIMIDHAIDVTSLKEYDETEMHGHYINHKGEKKFIEKWDVRDSDNVGSLMQATQKSAGRRQQRLSHVSHVLFSAASQHHDDRRPVGDDDGVWQNGVGTVFRVSALLKMAKTNVDIEMKDTHSRNKVFRSLGMRLLFRITYSNRASAWAGTKILPWQARPPKPWYTVSVTLTPADQYQFRQVDPTPSWDLLAKNAEIYELHGINILVQQDGEVLTWSTSKFLTTATVCLTFFALAELLMESFLKYVSKYKEQFVQHTTNQCKLTEGDVNYQEVQQQTGVDQEAKEPQEDQETKELKEEHEEANQAVEEHGETQR